MPDLKLGILDFCIPGPDQTAGERLTETLELAQRAEELGYERYWLSEHHGPGVAHASPELLSALILGTTSRIRAGPAGVLLRYYSPHKLADDARCLEALFPGRLNLGLARGSVAAEGHDALLDGRSVGPDSYARKVVALVGHLRGSLSPAHPLAAVPTCPAGPGLPTIWMLGSGTLSAGLAARLGTAFALSLFLQPVPARPSDALERYRARFRPRPTAPLPRCTVAVAGICARTEAEATRALRGHANPHIVPSVVGTPDQCREQLGELAAAYGVDEVVFAEVSTTADARRRAHDLLAETVGLDGAHDGRPSPGGSVEVSSG